MTNLDRIKQIALDFGCDVKENEPMKSYTTFKIGGDAQLLVTAKSLNGLVAVLKACRAQEAPCFILGRGSNLLVSDQGIEVVVLRLDGDFKSISLVDDDTVFCGAGVSLAKLCTFACEHSLSGLEFAWGIPGSAGGAAFMNAGAYTGEMKDVLLCCHHVTPDGTVGSIEKKNLQLFYRHSAYADNGFVITGIVVKLQKDSETEIRRRMDEFMRRRREKQPLEYPSAGSVFKRPKGYFAGTLIEQAGLKGYSIGDAVISRKHAGFIINQGDATAQDVLALIRHIQNTVHRDFAVDLVCEVRYVGR